MTLEDFARGLRLIGRAHHTCGCTRLDAQAGRADHATPRGPGLPPEPGPRPPSITTPMVVLAWALLECPLDTRAATALAQAVLKATGDLA